MKKISENNKENATKAFKLNIFKVYSVVYSLVAIPMAYYGLNFIEMVYKNIVFFLITISVVMVLSIVICYIVQNSTTGDIRGFFNNTPFDSLKIKKSAYYLPFFVVAVMDFGWLVLMNLIVLIPLFLIYSGNFVELIVMNMLVLSGALLSTPLAYFITENTSAQLLSIKEVSLFKEPEKAIKINLKTKILMICLILIISLVLNITSGMLLAILHNLTQYQTIVNIFVISGSQIVTAVVISIFFADSITKPILRMKLSANFIQNGDISITIQKTSNDELGDTSDSYNAFLEKLSFMIANIKDSVHTTLDNITELNNAMNSTGRSVNDINLISDEVRKVITNQSAIITDITTKMEQIAGTITKHDIKINDQTGSLSQSSAAIEEMLANISSIATNLNTNSSEFTNLHKAINAGNTDLETLKETVISLNRQSDSVIEANAIITNIASQTDLLAMNAAIEAAHAGEYGKGFAVVADEIRKLAEVSNHQSKFISENLNNLKKSIEEAVIITDKTEKSFEIIIKSIETVNNLEKEIKNSIDEQSSGSTQILQAINNINQITIEVHAGSKEMMNDSKNVISQINDLLAITEKVKSSSMSVVEKAKTVKEDADISLELIKTNDNNTKNINSLVEVFKIK